MTFQNLLPKPGPESARTYLQIQPPQLQLPALGIRSLCCLLKSLLFFRHAPHRPAGQCREMPDIDSPQMKKGRAAASALPLTLTCDCP